MNNIFMGKNKIKIGLIISMVFLFSASFSYSQSIPPYINYQGRLAEQDTGAPVDGSKSITFSLYETEIGGDPIYNQTQQVNINKGAFSVYLGKGYGYYDGNTIADGIPPEVFTGHAAKYLGIRIADSQTEMTPRQLIASAAYAYKAERAMIAEEADRAKEAEGLTGINLGAPGGIATLDENGIVPNHQLSLGTPGGIATLDPNGTIPSSQLPGITVDSADNVGIGTTIPGEKLSVEGIIESTAGGIKFPDGTIQTTASSPPWSQKLPTSERFMLVFDGEGVLDRETGLVWEREHDRTARPFDNAIRTCFSRATGGRYGWRAPNVEELMTLFDPATGGFFANSPFNPTGSWWTNTKHDKGQPYAVIYHSTAHKFVPDPRDKQNLHYSWCVRGQN